jgi:pyruvate dehydrogenase E2 component (dihydrolipoamide acetyltransferase)
LSRTLTKPLKVDGEEFGHSRNVQASPPPPTSKPNGKTHIVFDNTTVYASPVAKKTALQHGVPLSKVRGTGPDGRIVLQDVESYNSFLSTTNPSALPQMSEEYTDIPVSAMCRVIGMRLVQSKHDSPHYYLTIDIQMDKISKLRESFNKTLRGNAVKLSVNDFIVKAAALALVDVPEPNSVWMGEVIRQ